MLSVDKLARKPIFEQVIDGLEREILTGILHEGDKIPSVRELSALLGINPNTIQKAYIELDRRGVIITVPARGAFVAENAVSAIKNGKLAALDEMQTLLCELYTAGVAKETLLEIIDRIYDGGRKS